MEQKEEKKKASKEEEEGCAKLQANPKGFFFQSFRSLEKKKVFFLSLNPLAVHGEIPTKKIDPI